MKTFLIQAASAIGVALAFSALGKYDDALGWGQELLLWIAAYALLDALFIPRYPKAPALREALRLRKGQRAEAEGR